MRGCVVVLVFVVAVSLVNTTPAMAQDTVTPEGPATVRGNWLGGSTAEGRPPEILVGWSATVLPGGNGGPVRLRALRWGDRATLVGSGPREWLPSIAGTYVYTLPIGIPYDYRQYGLALDQEVGGHAIVRVHPSQPRWDGLGDVRALDVFRPTLGEDAADMAFSERRLRQELLVRGTIERDIDQDLLGDVTQDVGDLRLLGARIAAREQVSNWEGRVSEQVTVAARVLNAGTTVIHLPQIVRVDQNEGSSCEQRRELNGASICVGDALAPGAERELRATYPLWGKPEPTRVDVAGEGPDLTPQDNVGPIATDRIAGPLTPAGLTLRALRGRSLRVRLTAAHAGTATLAARVAGLRIRRTLRFAAPGSRTARLVPVARRDRRRLTAARRRPGRLRVTITATMGSARASARTTLP